MKKIPPMTSAYVFANSGDKLQYDLLGLRFSSFGEIGSSFDGILAFVRGRSAIIDGKEQNLLNFVDAATQTRAYTMAAWQFLGALGAITLKEQQDLYNKLEKGQLFHVSFDIVEGPNGSRARENIKVEAL